MWLKFLRRISFVDSRSDPSLFIKNFGKHRLFLFVYDIVITGLNSCAVDSITQDLVGEFVIIDLGSLNFFLGIQVQRTPDGIHFNQSMYLSNLLKRLDMDNLRPSSDTSPALNYWGIHFIL